MNTRNSRIAKNLSILWCVSYGVLAVVSTVYTQSQVLAGSLPLSEPTSAYHIITTLLVLFYFYPLLWVIHHYAKLAPQRKILVVSRALIGFLSFWLLCVFVMWIKHA